MHQFLKFIFGIKLYMFRTVRLSIIRSYSLYTQQTCMTYTIAVWTMKNSWWWTEELSETCRVLFQKSSSSYVCHGVRPLVDPFRSHVSRSLFRGLPRFLPPVGEYCFIILGSLSRGILFTCCIQFLLYSSSLSRTGVISKSFAICEFVL